MSEGGEEEPDEEFDFEELKEALDEEREERQSHVTFDQVETVRRAGELWRDTEDVETVAQEVDLSLETAKEVLTVYRLIFEDSPDVRMKSVSASRAYFSLEKEEEVKADLHNEDDDESVEDLLREYVGAIYLDNDIENVPVGEPPEAETPPQPFDWEGLDIGGIVPDISIPTSAISAMVNMSGVYDPVLQSHSTLFAGIAASEMHRTERMLASVLQPAIAQQQRSLVQGLSPLFAMVESHQKAVARSTSLLVSDAIADFQPPQTVLADLASIQPTVSAAAVANTNASFGSGQPVVDDTPTTTVDSDPIEAAGVSFPEADPAGATVDATLPDAGSFSTEFAVEIPTQITCFILAGAETREWYNGLNESYQKAVIGTMVGYIAFSMTGEWGAAGFAVAVATPVIRQALETQ